jgi:hypothetical protein
VSHTTTVKCLEGYIASLEKEVKDLNSNPNHKREGIDKKEETKKNYQ